MKLLCGFCLQLLYTRLKFCTCTYILVKLSAGVVCCYAVSFIYLRAGCYVWLLWGCFNSSVKHGFWKIIITLEIYNKF